ncbi:MAG: Uma2 family endonuclease, partial [Acidobacteriota bacterium]|nr:Uma2 family endonuclease [Acidobacteriota bacterium]
MGSLTALTVDEFMKRPSEEGVRYELSEGELIIVGTAAAQHEMVKSQIVQILIAYILRNPIGRVFSETSFVLGESTFRMPDVAFVGDRKLAHFNPDKMFPFAPDVAIEIVSEHDEAFDLETKIEQFLNAGSQAVCVVYM